MRIEIAERLRPFSHLPGTTFVLPGTSWSVAVFPALLRIHDLSGTEPLLLTEIKWSLEGPIADFTSILDLERGELRVFGNSRHGYFCYHLKALKANLGIAIHVDKVPQELLCFECKGEWQSPKIAARAGRTVFIGTQIGEGTTTAALPSASLERLSLGSHKLQDWALVRRRLSMDEIFPIWHRLGQLVPAFPSEELRGTALLLNQCRELIAANAPEKILEGFRHLFLTGFEGILSPRLVDTDFHGVSYHGHDLSAPLSPQDSLYRISPMVLLKEGAALIRSLFLQEEPSVIRLLPALPPEFHCGRFLLVKCGIEGGLNLEWTKKSIRCMSFSALKDQQMAFLFSNHERECRLRSDHRDSGTAYIPGTPLDIIAGRTYWFDRFQR